METLAALFILVMGVSAAIGLSIYSLNSSSTITKKIVGIGLAREAMEAVKNMRDTNWLNDALNTNCYNFVSGENDEKCYQQWLNAPSGFDLRDPDGSGLNKFNRIYVDSAPGGSFWKVPPATNQLKWGLNFYTNVNNSTFSGFYNSDNNGFQNGSSSFYRKIIFQEDNTTQPYNTNTGSRLKVTAQVWWTDQRCPKTSDWPGEGRCSVQMDSYLTNWKNYEY